MVVGQCEGRWGEVAREGGRRRCRCSVAQSQVDLLAVETVAGALGHSLPGELLAGEGDEGLAAALAAEVVEDENGVWLELLGRGREGGGRVGEGEARGEKSTRRERRSAARCGVSFPRTEREEEEDHKSRILF